MEPCRHLILGCALQGDGDTTKSAIFTHTAPDNIVSETVLLSVGLNNTQATVMVYQNGYPIS